MAIAILSPLFNVDILNQKKCLKKKKKKNKERTLPVGNMSRRRNTDHTRGFVLTVLYRPEPQQDFSRTAYIGVSLSLV